MFRSAEKLNVKTEKPNPYTRLAGEVEDLLKRKGALTEIQIAWELRDVCTKLFKTALSTGEIGVFLERQPSLVCGADGKWSLKK